MKIQILAAVLLSSFALSTAYAADEAMPANSMNQNASATADANKASDTTAVEKKHAKKHKKHKKNHKNHAPKAADNAMPADATKAATDTAK